MASWSEFSAAAPGLAGAVRELMQQYGPGLGYLATVRPDGGPRVHPVAPVITEHGLFCFVIDSPKRRDLERDGRYALHAFPPENSDDEAYIAGRARPVTDPALVHQLAERLRAAPHVDWRLFEFSVDVAMVARHGAAGAVPFGASPGARARVQVWRDPATRRPGRAPGTGSPPGGGGGGGGGGPALRGGAGLRGGPVRRRRQAGRHGAR